MEPLGRPMTGYPIQPAKVQRPPLRDETLARDRLLDWLAAKIHHRVILVLADAGYGKTTLLADFSRRTRRPDALVPARRRRPRLDLVPEPPRRRRAGARSRRSRRRPRRCSATSPSGGPTREAATDVFLRELPSIAEHGAVLILDDFHLVDESPDVRQIVRELVARAPERLSIVFASRRAPAIPLARLRAAGEVAELGTDDLRFDADRDRAPLHRDLRTRPRAGRPRRRRGADRGLGGLAPAGPGRPARPIAGGDPAVRPWPDRRRPGALRLPRRGGRRRPARGPAAVPDADVDPAGRDAGPGGVVAGLDEADVGRAHRRRRAADAPQPTVALVARRRSATTRSCASSSRRGCASTIGAAGRRRSSTIASPTRAADLDWRVAAYHYREAGDLRRSRRRSRRPSPKSWAAASMPRRSRRSTECPTDVASHRF